MNDETGFLAAVLRELAASTAVILAAWGALGGATNALPRGMPADLDAGIREAFRLFRTDLPARVAETAKGLEHRTGMGGSISNSHQ